MSYSSEYGGMGIPGGGIAQTVIDSNYLDMAKFISVRNTWEFTPPNIISFDKELYASVVEYNTRHRTLDTIPPDYYEKVFKPLCLVHTKEWVLALRSKYESLTTPFGEIRMNWQKLESDVTTEKEKLEQILELAPMDHFIYINV